jgi:hypothetical protein
MMPIRQGPEGIQYGNYVWEPTTVGKIDFLEMFSGSAKLSQSAAMQGLRVGAPIDLRTGYDLRTALPKDGERQWKSLSDNSQRSSTWHLLWTMESDAKH